MSENVHDQAGSPPPVGIPPALPQGDLTPLGDEEDEKARQELARISLSNEELLKLAAKCGPLPKWLDEDEDPPF
jgi:hypothetical protein